MAEGFAAGRALPRLEEAGDEIEALAAPRRNQGRKRLATGPGPATTAVCGLDESQHETSGEDETINLEAKAMPERGDA
jgi:hypothetical protein